MEASNIIDNYNAILTFDEAFTAVVETHLFREFVLRLFVLQSHVDDALGFDF